MQKSKETEGQPTEAGEETIETGIFRMAGGKFARELIFRYAGIWLVGLCIVGLAGLIFGVAIDIRWLIAGLMVIFIVIPLMLGIFYYYFGLRRECFVNALPHTLLINDDGITARLHLRERKEAEEAESAEAVAEAKDNKKEEEATYRIKDEVFPYSCMQKYTMGASSLIIPLRDNGRGFIWIPKSAFDDPEKYYATIDMLDRCGLERM